MQKTYSGRVDVPTDAPERDARQLVSHPGRRTGFTTDGATSRAAIAGGTGPIHCRSAFPGSG